MKKITLATLPQATAQEVFDQVRNHLLRQGERSHEGSTCLYRATRGLMCAAGCLMADDEYSKDMEERSWPTLRNAGLVPPDHSELICELQSIHDIKNVDEWELELSLLAKQYGLEFRD